MFVFSGAKKDESGVKRFASRVSLEPSLVALFKGYEQVGGPTGEVERWLDREMDACLGDARTPREKAQTRLYELMRAKEMHRWVTAEPRLSDIKLKLLEHLLFYRDCAQRWGAIRELLVLHLDEICGTPLPGTPGSYELYKRQLSQHSSALGRMLLVTALFNFDIDEEQPPRNLVIRFAKNRFPHHCWETVTEGGRVTLQGGPGEWSPSNPLCRWEYLAADIAHAVYRRQPLWRSAAQGSGAAAQSQYEAVSADDVTLYCRLDTSAMSRGGAEQMELFPVEPARFLPEVQRQVHRRLGADGVKLFALLMQRLATTRPGEVVQVSLAALVAAGEAEPPDGRTLRARMRRLHKLIDYLGEVELTRVRTAQRQCSVQTSRLLTVLGRTDDRPAADEAPDGWRDRSREQDVTEQHVRVLVDEVFHDTYEGTLGQVYRGIPPELMTLPARQHPYVVGLYAHLRRAWSADAADEPVVATARRLMQDAGFRVSTASRYRAVEHLKRDLALLDEHGVLRQWRITRSPQRDVLEDEYRLYPPRVADTPDDRATVATRAMTAC